jgi:glucosyl-3-phosphoglycerate synthase
MMPAFDQHDFQPESLVEAKGAAGVTIAVCLPAHNEADTVGPIVTAIRRQLVEQHTLVDELVVIDDHSVDDTAAVALAAGARVIDAASTLASYGGNGKGRALWRSLYGTTSDLIAWCDADVTNFTPHFVCGLLGPLLTEPTIDYVKGFYRRPLDLRGEGGGRVTELVARPILSLLYPELATFFQPLSGEYAGRREVLEAVPFVAGYGVEIGLLIDLSRRFGTERLAQVDLGTRRHRNRSLEELGPQALTILQVALRRTDPSLVAEFATLLRPGLAPRQVDAVELPSIASLRLGQ